MKVCVLGSGSKGNTTYIELGSTKLLIDAGLSFKQINSRAQDKDIDLQDLDGVLVTHEHNDHVAGLNVLLKRIDTTVYITEDTFDSLYFKHKQNISVDQVSYIQAHQPFTIKNIEIYPLSVSHDASDTIGYVLQAEDTKIVYITDIGYLPVKDYPLLENADLYVFESNYDVTMLFTSNRPFYLKQRIDSVKGHMSNADSAYNLSQLVGPKTKYIILAHPSRECNTAQLASDTLKEVFFDYGLEVSNYTIIVATQDIPTPVIEED